MRIAIARLRFGLLLGGVVLVVAGWPTLRNYWDRLTRPPIPDAGVSSATEYWCPMCPGVVADWPGKCPVCHMTLIRRLKGEMTPLPDGVVARMQFSPYRVQLAGIRTSPLTFLPLVREVRCAGLLEAPKPSGEQRPALEFQATVHEWDVGVLRVGQTLDIACDAFPGQTYAGRIDWLAPQFASGTRELRVRFRVDDARGELRPGMYVAGMLRVPLAMLPEQQRLIHDGWRDRTAVEIAARTVAAPFAVPAELGLAILMDQAIQEAALKNGLVPAIPESAVIDTGTRKVVFLNRTAGTFDAVEVRVGRRCGSHYALLGGVALGESVVTAGSYLLDAETRLNPAAAASYFGAGSRGTAAEPARAAPASLATEDQLLVERQKNCPVTDEPLGSMGAPVRVVVDGRVVFVCCEGCTPALKKNPGKFLAKLPK